METEQAALEEQVVVGLKVAIGDLDVVKPKFGGCWLGSDDRKQPPARVGASGSTRRNCYFGGSISGLVPGLDQT